MADLNDYQKRQLARYRAANYRRHGSHAGVTSHFRYIGAQLLVALIAGVVVIMVYLDFLMPLAGKLIKALTQ